MSIPADPFDNVYADGLALAEAADAKRRADSLLDGMLATITTVMQSPTRPVAFALSTTALKAVRAQCVAVLLDGELRQLCGVRVITMDSQTEPIRAFFSNDELAEYLRT